MKYEYTNAELHVVLWNLFLECNASAESVGIITDHVMDCVPYVSKANGGLCLTRFNRFDGSVVSRVIKVARSFCFDTDGRFLTEFVKDVIYHEIIHASGVSGHGYGFHEKMDAINTKLGRNVTVTATKESIPDNCMCVNTQQSKQAAFTTKSPLVGVKVGRYTITEANLSDKRLKYQLHVENAQGKGYKMSIESAMYLASEEQSSALVTAYAQAIDEE